MLDPDIKADAKTRRSEPPRQKIREIGEGLKKKAQEEAAESTAKYAAVQPALLHAG